MKYILDFDRTVFDMDRLYQEIARVNPQTTVGTIASLSGIDLTSFIFPDARDFLAQQQPSDIYIVSSCYGQSAVWDMEYQTEKIRRSGIAQYVNQVFVVPESKTNTIKRLTLDGLPAVFVDDHPAHVQAVAVATPHVHTIFLNRTGTSATDVTVPSITSLTELEAVLLANQKPPR